MADILASPAWPSLLPQWVVSVLPDEAAVPGDDKTAVSKLSIRGVVMSWVLLVVAGLLEVVWATALGVSHGFSRLVPSLVFVAAMVASMIMLGLALQRFPIGMGYATFVGIGAIGTALVGMIALGETVTLAKIICLVAIIGGVVGLKLVT
jgi:quaternary ammonium compound-resistance protein SugE